MVYRINGKGTLADAFRYAGSLVVEAACPSPRGRMMLVRS